MSEHERERQGRNGPLIDTAERAMGGVARLGYGILGVPLRLLPPQTRAHIHNAIRELSYGFASLPGDFADIAGEEIERWARAGEAAPARQSLTVEIADAPAAPAAPAAALGATIAPAEPTEPAPPPDEPVAAAGMTTTGVAITYIEYDPPGRDVDGEYVMITNSTDAAINMVGWTLSDGDSKHIYHFPAYTLAPGTKVKLWTKRGKNNATNLYWQSRSAIWNNDGDTGTLKDAAGATISVYTYTGKK